ncbi:hypothetical protein A1E_00550 [Rickettsia canadensis str. McKiel]|uniref:Uncharacterized protein n=1 Tax=Rickettsia canadensis (strain McKiel) TaxID=293613 RepID=A8EXH5_RICCK|nr:hypothetical protein A1E_00550 [Rickettsia canadensis str. McKiel]
MMQKTKKTIISTKDSRIKVFAVLMNEELILAEEVMKFL